MKTWTFETGHLTEGLSLTPDLQGKLGNIVFLGQAARDTHHARVALARRNPAQVISGKVLNTEPQKITLRSGQPNEFSFWVLAKPRQPSKKELIRVNTAGTYTRSTQGGWKAIEGNPERIVGGSGKHSDSARVCSYSDSLVVMRPGDVIRVKLSGGYKFKPYVLYFNTDGELTVSLFEEWKAAQSGQKTAETTNAVEMMFGTMPIYSFGGSRRDGWGINTGIETTKLVASGRAFTLGPREDKGWRQKVRKTVAVAEGLPSPVTEAAVAKVDHRIVLLKSETREPGKCLVRVNTAYLRKGGRTGADPHRESPTLLAEGWMEIGTANVQHHRDQLYVVTEGDVLRIGQVAKRYPADYVVYVKGGVAKCELFDDWERKDAEQNPQIYLAQKRTIPSQVPPEWIGKPVVLVEEEEHRGERSFREREPYVLVEVEGSDHVCVQLDWENPDPERNWNVTQHKIWWVILRDDLKVPEPEETKARQADQEGLKQQLEAIKAMTCFPLAEESLKERIKGLTWGIQSADWEEQAQAALDQFNKVRAGLEKLQALQDSGQILIDFGGHYRQGGMANNENYWVIQSDGSLREADTQESKLRQWQFVTAKELALRWVCGTMRDVAGSSLFEVAKMPIGGCTEAQLETVKQIEQELGVPNAFGLDTQAQAKEDALLVEIVTACRQSRMLRSVPNLEFLNVTGTQGQRTNDDEGHIRGRLARHVKEDGEFPVEVSNRQAQLIEQMEVAGGILEFLVYHKFGQWNLNIRWRKE